MRKKVIFIRHGEALHNTDPALKLTAFDAKLTEKGFNDAKSAGQQLIGFTPDLIIVSPLERTLQTATAAFEHYIGKVPFIANESCRESLSANKCNHRGCISEKKIRFPHISFDGLVEEDELRGADLRDTIEDQIGAMMDRAQSFLSFVESRPELNIIVVSHGRFMTALTASVTGINKHHAFMISNYKNGELLRLEYGPAGRPMNANREFVWNAFHDIKINGTMTELEWV